MSNSASVSGAANKSTSGDQETASESSSETTVCAFYGDEITEYPRHLPCDEQPEHNSPPEAEEESRFREYRRDGL
jgi:hypothetical protein